MSVAPLCSKNCSDGQAVRNKGAGELAAVGLVWLEVVEGRKEEQLWNEHVDRYQYLGYHKSLGCFLR